MSGDFWLSKGKKPAPELLPQVVDVLAVREGQVDRAAALAGLGLHRDRVLGDRELLLELARDLVLHDLAGHARVDDATQRPAHVRPRRNTGARRR